jgi:CRISPR system Cascade subunit CasA
MSRYDLIEEPWLPCRFSDGGVRPLGLRETLSRAGEIGAIVDESPPVVAALHRLLLALVHRTFGPRDVSSWRALWETRAFDPARLEAYFGQYADRFDLFHPEHPFYQTASIVMDHPASVARLAPELAEGAGNSLFNHSLADAAVLTPAKAARYLVAHQAFALGGLVSFQRGEPPNQYRSADMALLTKGAVALVRGATLFETLLLNLHRYDPQEGVPCRANPQDRPAWERDGETRAEDRLPDGYLDLLTWQSRRIRLIPEADAAGATVVRSVLIMKGNQLPGGVDRRRYETMLAYKMVSEPRPGQDPWPAITFREGRALWRDSQALLQSIEQQQQQPRTLEWLAELVEAGVLLREQTLRLDFYGLSVDRAKVYFWRHEQLPLPLAYLKDPDLYRCVTEALEWADLGAKALREGTWILAQRLLAPESDQESARQPDQGAVGQLMDHLGWDRRYWPRLEASFLRVLVDLAAPTGGADPSESRERILADWQAEVRGAAQRVLAEVVHGLDPTARSLKAAAQAQRRLGLRLYQVFGATAPTKGAA